jgi:hypothetical protein
MMPTITLNEIRCSDPKGVRDDMMLTLAADEMGEDVIWGPQRMRRGDRIELADQLSDIEYDNFAIISLYEHDSVGNNDSFGSMVFGAHEEDRTLDFPFPSMLNTNYFVNYTLQAEPVTPPQHQIQLIRLVCDDAQGTKDRVRLYVNNNLALGPIVMQKDSVHNFPVTQDPIGFRNTCLIRLEDTQGQDWSRSFILRAGEYPTDIDLLQYFSVHGHGVIGDAYYRLYYRMLA